MAISMIDQNTEYKISLINSKNKDKKQTSGKPPSFWWSEESHFLLIIVRILIDYIMMMLTPFLFVIFNENVIRSFCGCVCVRFHLLDVNLFNFNSHFN